MIRLKNPLPSGWKPVPEEVFYKGKRTRVPKGDQGTYFKSVDGEVVLVVVGKK